LLFAQGIAVMLLRLIRILIATLGHPPAAMEIMAIAGICGATAGLARTGILDDKPHTANAPEYFRQRTIGAQPSIKTNLLSRLVMSS